MLQSLDKEEDQSSLSYKFKNCEDNFIWVFTACLGPQTGRGEINCGKIWEPLEVYGGSHGV